MARNVYTVKQVNAYIKNMFTQDFMLNRENEGADFILEVGSHIRFKRKLFEDYLDTASTV